ncbi:hypothetical protein LBMAG42_00230 [Deltaproteobacteria bacterium]|nr:hypothetical protein LBMAG42_00230 [Deltaproteobacteria bacterium]
MASPFNLTGGPVRVTAPTVQPLAAAIDLGEYPEINAVLNALEIVGGGSATVRILTSTQNRNESGWVVALTFSAISQPNSLELKQTLSFLRYIRWEVSALTGSSPALTFAIEGVAKGRD